MSVVLAGICSLCLSVWAVFQDPVVNRDGVDYLRVAERILDGDWSESLSLYQWSVYPPVIAACSALAGVSVEGAVHIVNAIFLVIVVVTFISIVKEINGDRRVLGAAAIVILLYASLNEYRSYVTRDASYLAFYLLSLLFFFRHSRFPGWKNGLGFGFFMLLASSFRIEGLVFLLCAPFVHFLQWKISFRRRVTAFLQANTILILSSVIVALAIGFQQQFAEDPGNEDLSIMARVEKPYNLTLYYLNAVGGLPQKAAGLEDLMLAPQSFHHALAIYLLGLGYIVLAGFVNTLTPLHAGLTLYGLWKRAPSMTWSFFSSWLFFLLLNVLVLGLYVARNFFLSGRYPLAMCLTVLLVVPSALAALYARWREKPALAPRNWLFPVVAILLVVSGVDGIVSFGESKVHVMDAGLWVREHAPRGAKVYTNDSILSHYARLETTKVGPRLSSEELLKLAQSQALKNYEYVAVVFRKQQRGAAREFVNAFGAEATKVFKSGHGGTALVFVASQ